MTVAEEFGPDLDQAIPETFDTCPECGTPTVQLSSHTCPSAETVEDPTRDELDRRVEQDPFTADETVLVRRTNRSNTYAYHEMDESDNPLCPVNNSSEDGFKQQTRTQAQDQRYAPCQFCQRIRESREVGE